MNISEMMHRGIDVENNKEKRIVISRLKQEGVNMPGKIYDSLHALGIPNDLIRKPRYPDSELEMDNDRANYLLRSAPEIIKRLRLIDSFKVEEFSVDNLDEESKILNLTEEQFLTKRQLLQPFFFLDRDNYKEIFYKPSFDLRVKKFIEYFTSEFLEDGNNKVTAFESIKSDFFSFLSAGGNDFCYQCSDFTGILTTIINSDLKQNQLIVVPDFLVTLDRDLINHLNRCSSREEQRSRLNGIAA